MAEPTPADREDDVVAEPAPAAREGNEVAVPVFKLMDIVNVVFSLPSPSPVVHLRESDAPFRGLGFPIGLPEAQSIALALDREKAVRPSTHELLSAVIVATGSDVAAVRFTGERDGTIIAELDLMTPNGHQVIDCRPTDGIAIALRQAVPVPILCDETLLDD
jgi:bifunctional DNase/RNase